MSTYDLFGQAFKDHFEGKRHRLTIERDDGYRDRQDFSEYFEEYQYFPDVEKKALEHAKGRVLDIGVGAGRVAIHLQNKGLEVVGIDLSDYALEVSRKRGVRQLVKMSACNLRFKKSSFDTAIAFGNNFGLCGSMEGVRGMLERLRDILNDDGVFLAESIHATNTTNKHHLKYHKMNITRGRPPGQVTIRERYRLEVGDWFDLLMVTPDEMNQLCGASGWRVNETYEGSPYYTYVLKKA